MAFFNIEKTINKKALLCPTISKAAMKVKNYGMLFYVTEEVMGMTNSHDSIYAA
jgi:hypothetical protein